MLSTVVLKLQGLANFLIPAYHCDIVSPREVIAMWNIRTPIYPNKQEPIKIIERQFWIEILKNYFPIKKKWLMTVFWAHEEITVASLGNRNYIA